VTANGFTGSLDALIAAAQGADASLNPANGITVVALSQCGATAIDTGRPLILLVDTAPSATHLPGRLGTGWELITRLYGADRAVTLLPSGRVSSVAACGSGGAGESQAIYLAGLDPLDAFATPWTMPWLSARLRAPDGCPWDREQTHSSLAKHLIEEAWELHDAIAALESASEGERPRAIADLAEELGDVLLQVVLHAQIAQERGDFDLADVQDGLVRKIVRRHPHVFGDASAETTRDVQRNWEAIKAGERAAAGEGEKPKGALDGVSRGLPALSASRELQDRASAVGYDWPTLDGVRAKISEELAEIVTKHGDERRSKIVAGLDGDVTKEDLIPEEEMVISLTRGGYIKRTKSDNYRSQHRGGKGVKGASLRADDVVEHFFVTTTHHWLLFFTNKGRVYRAKAHEVLEAGRDTKGQHVANLLALQPDEQVASVLDIKDYNQAPYLVLATRNGLVKKTALTQYDTARSGGIIAIKLREDDELIDAMLVNESDGILLVSRKGMSVRFSAANDSLRAMGRDTSGVMGMSFRKGDALLSASVINDVDGAFVFVVTEGGYAKRTSVDQYRAQNRGGLGIKVAKLEEKRGDLVGALIVSDDDEVLVVLESGRVVRSAVAEVPAKGRDTMGVVFARFEDGDSILGLARNTERNLEARQEAKEGAE